MSTVHRTLDGCWAPCPTPEGCALLFHFPGVTVAEMRAMPMMALLPLLEAMDPPTVIEADGMKSWKNEEDEYHRDYDLPAAVEPSGNLYWFRDGLAHRDGDKPASIFADGTAEWYQDGWLHRENNLPAATFPSGKKQYWERGIRVRTQWPWQ